MLANGTTLGRYRIVEKIGAGGMGIVYKARDERLDRDVALKVLPPGRLGDQVSRARFRKEALALSRIAHPNIAVVHDFDTVENTDFLVMELVPGLTLEQQIPGRRFAESEAINVATQILDGLAAAHQQNVVHSDIKPSNIRLTPDEHVKILDFGLARFVKHSDPLSATMSITQDQGIAGTLAYMAPEQLRGSPLDARSDLYSAGCVLYEIATGRHPVAATTAPLIIDSILNKSPEKPRLLVPEISPGLEYIILKSLERDPARRYQSAKEMAADLRRVSTLTASVPVAAPATRAWSWQSAWRSVAYLALLALIVFAVLYFRLRRPAMNSIAILPLTNLTGNADMDYLSDGITDALINNVSQLPNLKVISGSSVLRYKGRNIDPQSLGRDLQVQTLLTGKYTERGNNLLISVELSDARDNRHIWGEQYNRNLADIDAVQEEVSRQITDMLRLKVTEEQRQRISRKQNVSPEAYQLYLKGRHYQLKDTPDDLRTSREYYERAIDVEPTYAPAYVGVAQYYGYMAWSGEISPKEAGPKQEAAATRAAQLDPSLGIAHCELGAVNLFYKWDWATAEKELQRCIALAPNEAEAHFSYAIYLRTMHRFDEALVEAQRAEILDPLTPERKSMIGLVNYFARRYEPAAEQYRQLIQSDPALPGPHMRLFDIYSRTGNETEAMSELQKGLALQGAEDLAGELPEKYKSSGFEAAKEFAAREQIKILLEASKQEYIAPTALATNYSLMNEKDRALEWLEKASSDHSPDLLDLNLDPDYDNLHSDKRFQDLVQRIGLP